MSEIVDALGTAATGTLLGRAVEPQAGDSAAGADGHTHETACLNCGTELVGPHCHSCGQRGHVHKTIGAFFHDLLHGVFHFEGKVWHTLPMLAWKPGELTRRYIAGERARFVSPMALFLFSVFLMFAVFQVMGIAPPSDMGAPVKINMEAQGTALQQQIDGLRTARASMGDGNPAAPILDRQIEAAEKRQTAAAARTQAPTEAAQTEDDATVAEVADAFTVSKTGWEFLDHGIAKWRENPSLMAYKLQANSYKFSWLLIPLSIPFVWLLFAWKRRFGAYDHAVFVTYSLCFMTLLFVTLTLLSQVPGTATALFFAITFIPPFHIYRQLKGAYSLSRFSALWRTAALLGLVFLILFLFVDLLLVMGAMG